MLLKFQYPLLFLLAFVLGWTCALSMVHSFDIFWHIAMFRDFWESGLSPFYDHLSYTFNGTPLGVYPPLPFQALAYGMTEWMGINVGIQATKALAFWITLFAWFCVCIRFRWGLWISALGTILLIGALQTRAIARPEILIYPMLLLISAWTVAQRKRASYSTLWKPMTLLMAATFTHFGASICFLVAGSHSVGRAVDGITRRNHPLLGYAIVSGLLFLLVGYANPNFQNPLIDSLIGQIKSRAFDAQGAVGLIREYRVPEGRQLTILAIFAPAVLACLPRWVCKRQWVPLILFAGFGYLSLTLLRAVPWVIIVLLPWICMTLVAYQRKWRSSGRRSWVQAAVFICGIAWWFYPGNHLRNPSFGVLYPMRYPVGLEHSLDRAEGNVYALYHYGGYIAYFHPQLKINADGRIGVVYPLDFATLNVEAAKKSEAFVSATSKPVAADFVLSANDHWPLTELAARDERYVIDDADQFFVLFRRGTGRYPLATALLGRPECGVRLDREAVETELAAYVNDEAIIPDSYSNRLRGLSLVEAVHRAVLALDRFGEDGAVFPPEAEEAFIKHHRVARAAAWVAGSRSMHRTAAGLFGRLGKQWFRDSDIRAYAASIRAAGLEESARQRFLRARDQGPADDRFPSRMLDALDARPDPVAVFVCEAPPGRPAPG
jgi:hypothetical protein